TQAEWETTEMGTAVADLIVNQIANPEAGLDDPAPEGGEIDGEKAARSLDAYRAALPGADAGTGEVVINIGK
ncbi:MAG: hypothetical protein KJO85_02105, partial [Gammaproteobacteria bacterium]|nr:hypothetical protein [Gammaproteobacteria bacterium]